MADKTSNDADRTPTAAEKTFNETPASLSKPTLVMVGAAILFLIIFGILFFSFMSKPAGGGANSEQTNTATR